MKFTKRNVSKLERIISDTFKDLGEKPLYKLEYCDDYIEFRFDGTLYDCINETDMLYASIGQKINDYLEQFENKDSYYLSVIRFYE